MQSNVSGIRTWRQVFAIATVTMASALTGEAYGQGAEGLEEIVVTARRTTENVQDVPLTVEVVSGDRLQKTGVTNASEIRNLVSNVQWDDNGGGTTENRITVRGLSSNASRQGFDPGVGIYIDDVYIGDTTGFNSALLDIDRIEVLKGPQGTLFGRNTTAGAIAIHTRRPDTEQFLTDLKVKAGNYELMEGQILTNIPLDESLALKFAGFYRDRDGYQENVIDGSQSLNSETYYGGRAQLYWTPSSDLDVLLSADYFRNDDLQNVMTCFGGLVCGFNPEFGSIFEDKAADNSSHTERTLWSAALNVDWRLSDLYELTSVTAYQSREYHNDQDQDFTPAAIVRSGFHMPDDWQASQELRVSSASEHAVRGVAGLYVFHEDRSVSIPLIFGSDAATLLGLPPTTLPLVSTTDARTKTTSWSVFGQASFDLAPTVTGELGVRYTDDSKDFSYVQRVTSGIDSWPLELRGVFGVLDPSDPLPAGRIGPLSASDDWSKVTGLASVMWQPADDLSLYLRYSQGYKSGGFQSTTVSSHFEGAPTPDNLVVDSNPQVPFGPEDVDAWELGIKAGLFRNRIRVNASMFYMDYSEMQLQFTDPITRAKTVVNAGDAVSKGIEVELSALLWDALTLDAALGVQRAELTHIAVAIPGLEADDRLPYAPDSSASLSATYQHGLANGWTWTSTVTASYRAEMWLDLSNTPEGPGVPVAFVSPDLTLLGARVGLETTDKWGIYLWGNNLTDKRVITSTEVAPLPYYAQAFMLNVPRTFGIEITKSL